MDQIELEQWKFFIYDIFTSEKPIEKYFEHIGVLVVLPYETFSNSMLLLNVKSLSMFKYILSGHVLVKFDKLDENRCFMNIDDKAPQLMKDIYQLSVLLFTQNIDIVNKNEFDALFCQSKSEFCQARIKQIKKNLEFIPPSFQKVEEVQESFQQRLTYIGKIDSSF